MGFCQENQLGLVHQLQLFLGMSDLASNPHSGNVQVGPLQCVLCGADDFSEFKQQPLDS